MSRKDWIAVDLDGLERTLSRRVGKVWLLHELLANVYDTQATFAKLTLQPVAGRPLATLVVEDDDPNGFRNLADAYTLYAESGKKVDPTKRGRWNAGEKLVIACCEEVEIHSTTGKVFFDKSGRGQSNQSAAKRERGTVFTATVRMTREEMETAPAAHRGRGQPPMSAAEDIVHVGEPAPGARTEELHNEQPDTPKVGRWYYVRDRDIETGELSAERWLGCVTRLGSNYVRLTAVEGEGTERVHNHEFWERCEFVEDPETLLRGNAERCRRELDGLMEEVKQLTSSLGVAPSQALGAGEAQETALTLATSAPAAEYKTALVKAKEETLPALFEQIQEKSKEFAQWMGATVIPMKAEAEGLKPAIERVEDRIFSVELYAGLCEEVEQVKDGEPAALTEPVHLFQRRLYMDEECLANYSTGGMEFKNIRAFDRWLCRKDNLDRVLPFPRTIVSFQVRHKDKEREVASLADFVRVMDEKKLDKLTFLYIRNGSRVYRLNTEINFGEKLFPDVDHPVLSAGEGKVYADLFHKKLVGEAEYLAMVKAEEEERAEYKRRIAEENKKPKKERQYISSPSSFRDSSTFEAFTKDSVKYDDIARFIRKEMEQHNRVVLVLQGLLDRSPALHPHPQWRLFEPGGFGQALALHRDSDRVLVAGDKPDFEAFRARLNASIGVGTVTIGQEEAWLRYEARKESDRRDRDYRWARVDYRPSRFKPEGDQGPGRFARVARVDRQGHVHYRWTKERRGGNGPPVGCKYGCKVGRVLNVDAYQPGDYKQFFNDPRTREEYLEWAPFLLAAEEYKAGNYGEVAPVAEMPKPAPRPQSLGRSEYAYRKMLQGFLGKAVRIRSSITTKGGKKYAKDSFWRVTHLERGEFTITGIDEKGTVEPGREVDGDGWRGPRSVRCVSHRDFYVESSIQADPKYQYKPAKRERAPIIDEEEP